MERTGKHFRKRDAILNCVRCTTTHPSAEWVFEHVRQEVPDISLATVYRNLSLFKEQGLITSLGTVKGVERFDGNTEPHVHFICTQCGGVQDLPEISVPEELNSAVARSSGGRVDNCQLSFTGICGECRKMN
ncbi:MAG: transcriptional repressor [Oscillospiraceae bacterium]|nr:transcriptional repressor [Oscillospiraceae bacterium]